MDKIFLLFGIAVAVALITSSGFGILEGSPINFGFFSGPKATGPGGGSWLDFGDGYFDDETIESDPTPYNPPPEEEGRIEIQSVFQSNTAGDEYILVQNNTNQRIPITGWSIGNTEGKRYQIGVAARAPLIDVASTVLLEPREEIYIHTGRSALGYGFRENGCLGYLTNGYDLDEVIHNSCYSVELPSSRQFNDQCIQYLRRFQGSCEVPYVTEDDLGLSYDCQEFARVNFGYQACVAAHKSDANFYKDIWHVYLDRPVGLWREFTDVITLYDSRGTIVDTYEY